MNFASLLHPRSFFVTANSSCGALCRSSGSFPRSGIAYGYFKLANQFVTEYCGKVPNFPAKLSNPSYKRTLFSGT